MIRLLLFIVLMSGCTSIGHAAPPSDWPDLKVIPHYVSQKEMRDQCAKWVTLGDACSVINFQAMTCEQWFDKDVATSALVRHENDHCRGKDHLGSTYLRDLWTNWKRK